MTKKEIFYFTGRCLTMEEHPGFRKEIIDRIAADDLDWPGLIGFCSDHLIVPTLFLKFKSQKILEYLPEEVREYFQEIYDLNLERNNQILKQLQEITGILNKGGVFPVFLKGAGYLLDGLYSTPGERMMGDIDFLVPEKDYLRSAQLLENEGYSIQGTFYGEIESLKHYPPLVKDGAPAHLEIHRLPVAETFRSWFGPELIFKEKKTVSSLSGCYVLSGKHNIIHNFIHSQLGHSGHIYGIVSFRDLYDLFLLSKKLEIKQVLPEIRSRQKAIAYFVFAGQAFSLPGIFYPKVTPASWLFLKKHELNLKSKVFYRIHRTVVYVIHRVIIGFSRQILKSFYSGEMRRSVLRRLGSRQWWRDHRASYRKFFAPDK